ncbi:MAG: hypothetical protein OXR67_15115 [Chloroflexota bacterium]|nr:hypothetical protein [Chloroflexota bacterium]
MTSSSPGALNQSASEWATLAVRILTFVLTLAILGAFLLPWVTLDGDQQASTGLDILVLVTSPSISYFNNFSQLQTAVLIGNTTGILLLAIYLAVKYARRRLALLATAAILLLALSLPYGARDLLVRMEYSPGLAMVIGLAVLLLLQQVLIKLRLRLQAWQKFPAVHRALGITTGSGRYRWPQT